MISRSDYRDAALASIRTPAQADIEGRKPIGLQSLRVPQVNCISKIPAGPIVIQSFEQGNVRFDGHSIRATKLREAIVNLITLELINLPQYPFAFHENARQYHHGRTFE